MNWQSSCLSLPSAGIIGVGYYIWLFHQTLKYLLEGFEITQTGLEYCFHFFFFVVLGMESRALYMLGKHWATSPAWLQFFATYAAMSKSVYLSLILHFFICVMARREGEGAGEGEEGDSCLILWVWYKGMNTGYGIKRPHSNPRSCQMWS
jgi:hypothetical protein